MTEFNLAILLALLAGLGIPAGGWLATLGRFRAQWLQREFRHFVIALGGGVLLGAVALVLIPEGLTQLNHSLWAISIFVAGGGCFFCFERLLGLRRREAPQLTGMLLDFIPEALALGGLLALGSNEAWLLALLIATQNIPEGFNGFREMVGLTNRRPAQVLLFMLCLSLLGPLAAVVGYVWLADMPQLLGGIMLFASGGILYLLFQDIAPQSHLRKHWAPPLGAVIGFTLAMAGQLALQH
ncbi:divalent cation transporter [Bowmanella denitrificans]|uniref:Divalent cation transporter n=1 Tax=Bowmanella denitrificans TaxID=366582 RepID=A0ABN0XDJ5_9ALTE